MRAIYTILFTTVFTCLAGAQTEKSNQDAWPLYEKTVAHIKEGERLGKISPRASGLEYSGIPPYPAEWHRLAKEAYEFNADAFELTRKARARSAAHWPVVHKDGQILLPYLDSCRIIAIGLGDAAVYQHVLGNDAESIEYIRDVLHLAKLLDADPDELAIQMLFATGVRSTAMSCLNVILSDASLTADPVDHKHIQAGTLKDFIRLLFTNDDPSNHLSDVVLKDFADGGGKPDAINRFQRTLRREQMERNLTAMSLACHLYHFEKSHWPASLAELMNYLPAAPTDTWGPMKYALIKSGCPDGSDRPLVYSNAGAKEGLFYRIDAPQYNFYPGANDNRPQGDQKQGGQFRDVVLWQPAKSNDGPTTRPLQ